MASSERPSVPGADDAANPESAAPLADDPSSAIDRSDAASTRLAGQPVSLEATLSFIPDFIYAFDREGRFVYANPATQALLGRSEKEIIGSNFADLAIPTS